MPLFISHINALRNTFQPPNSKKKQFHLPHPHTHKHRIKHSFNHCTWNENNNWDLWTSLSSESKRKAKNCRVIFFWRLCLTEQYFFTLLFMTFRKRTSVQKENFHIIFTCSAKIAWEIHTKRKATILGQFKKQFWR